MRKGCRHARTLFLLMLCQSLLAESSISAAFSQAKENNAKVRVKSVSNLPTSEDVDDSLSNTDYCIDQETDAREASFNFDPNTLNNRHVRVKRGALNVGTFDHSDSIMKRSLRQFKDKSSYSGEAEPETLALANKELSKYAENMEESRLNSDEVEKYTDQDLSMDDDFEPKDLVKRGTITGGEYEEVDEDEDLSNNLLDDTDQIQDNGNADSLSENEATKDESNWEGNDDSKLIEGQADLQEKSKNLIEKHGNAKRFVAFNDQIGLEGDVDSKSVKDAKRYEAELRETRGESALMSKSEGHPMVDLSKVVDIADSDTSQRQDAELDDSINSDDTSKQNAGIYNDYEKRAEVEIQRKIDRIKQDIKREIEQNQRLREIQENNAKFDELRLEEKAEDDDSQLSKLATVRKRQTVKKAPRQSRAIIRSHDSTKFNKRSTGKIDRKRENRATVKRKVDSSKTVVKRGSARTPLRTNIISKLASSPIKKREYARQVILVDNADDTKKRKRRSEHVKRNAEESVGASPLAAAGELEKEAGEGAFSLVRKTAPISLRDSAKENKRLAADYNEAFGGLQGDPRASLARYKRIKRVLKVPS